MPPRSTLLALFATLVALVAAPAASASGEGWCGGPCSFDVKKLGTGAGTVRGANGQIDCGIKCRAETDYEEPVFLIATPASGSVFTGWMGPCELPDAGDRCNIRLNNGPVTFIAVFDVVGAPPTPLEEPGSGAPPTPPVVPPPPDGVVNPRGCTIFGTGGDDVIMGTSGDDVICAGAGNDHIHGGGGNDVVYGDGDNDEIEGHGGGDRLYGGRGNDILKAGAGNDLGVGGRGRDVLFGGIGRDELRVRDGFRDAASGGRGSDTAYVDRLDRVRTVERGRLR